MIQARQLKILLVNRHMNIGGVETYLYRLCAGLCARGHQVGLLTEGGLWEAKAVEAGATLHRISSLSRDWSTLLPLLKSLGYDLVHAHNYHSARVGRRLATALGLPYLMSVHGPRPRLKQLLFRDWSREVIVMSEGDRDNIRWIGGVPASRISLSFYGIDTDRFHPKIDVLKTRVEAGLVPGQRTLVFISRFSNRKADVGHALLDAMPTLAQRFGDLVLLIVGEGPESAALEAHVERLNASSPNRLAKMIGPRKDVECFMALATVAVCTANTALEAIACGTPTLAAGRTGYFGLVTPQCFEAAQKLCFADHGKSPEKMSPTPFLRDLPGLLSDPDSSRRKASELVPLIAERMSVPRMAADMEAIYRRTLET